MGEIKNSELSFYGKIFIRGKIKVLTGLHIGGSKATLDIGGVDLPVIKTPQGIPYIPGSSLKGKMRSLLGRKEGANGVENDGDEIQRVFGCSKKKSKEKGEGEEGKKEECKKYGPTRIIVRDACLNVKSFLKVFKEYKDLLDTDFTEVKSENTINRITGKAENLRQIERVPVGAEFDFEIVYNVLDKGDIDDLEIVFEGMKLLEDDYLGGHGSRGYGKVSFKGIKIVIKNKEYYEGKKDSENELPEVIDDVDMLLKKFSSEIKGKILEKLNESSSSKNQ